MSVLTVPATLLILPCHYRNELSRLICAVWLLWLPQPALAAGVEDPNFEPGTFVTFAWNPNPDPLVVGYRLHWGATSRRYSNMVDVGKATSATVTGLMARTVYYFAATCYTTNGLQSDFSAEITHTLPISRSSLQLTPGPRNQAILKGAAVAGSVYEVQAADRLSHGGLTNWTVIGSVTAGSNNSFQFIDLTGTTQSARFYRLRQMYPATKGGVLRHPYSLSRSSGNLTNHDSVQ